MHGIRVEYGNLIWWERHVVCHESKHQRPPTRSKKGRQQLEQPVYSETDSRKSARGNTDKNTTQDLFELLERVQSSRLDDQRCVLPPYFTQLIEIAAGHLN
ncbi:hypothetical protein PV325_011870 [Microctonus aethiopoides]|nr:hypothetical protein PV325_011870 [Microctonus aethiopoides]